MSARIGLISYIHDALWYQWYGEFYREKGQGSCRATNSSRHVIFERARSEEWSAPVDDSRTSRSSGIPLPAVWTSLRPQGETLLPLAPAVSGGRCPWDEFRTLGQSTRRGERK